MMSRFIRWSTFAVALVAMPSVVMAQGTLSTQGFGYPPGQLSTRSLATGPGIGEFDPDSQLNP